MQKATNKPNTKNKERQESPSPLLNQYLTNSNDQALSVTKAKEILRELDGIVAAAQLFIDRYHITRKKLDEIYSSTKRKSKLTAVEIASIHARVIANRQRYLDRVMRKAQEERQKANKL